MNQRLYVYAAAPLLLVSAWACDVARSSEGLGGRPADPAAVEAEVQRVFDDAACWCESDVFAPYLATVMPTPPPASLITELPDREAALAIDDPRYRAFVMDRTETSARCGLGPDAARGALSDRQWAADDSLANACTGTGSLTVRNALCRAELDHCLGHELSLAAASSTRPLPPAVRDEVRNESVRRLQAASVRAVVELARLRAAGVCPAGSTDPDCIRLANGYESRLYTRVSDAASTALVAAHGLALDARRESDVVTPGQVETTGFGAQMFGPASSRAAMMQELYGATPVTGAPEFQPEQAIDAPAPSYEEVPPPPSLLPLAFRSDTMRVIQERSDLTIAAPLTLDRGATTLPAGTVVDVWIVHLAPLRNLRRNGTLTFRDRRVLGLLTTDTEIAGTHATLGNPGTTYSSDAGVGLEADDRFTVGRSSVNLILIATTTSVDEVRIVTPAFPELAETVVSARRGGDLPFAGRTYGDVRTARMLGLLSRYRISFPHRACLDASTGEVTNAEWDAILRDPSESMFEALELAVGRELVGPSFMRGMTIVTETYGVGQSDIADALDYVRDAETVLDGLVLAPASGCGPSILRVSPLRQRNVRALQAAFARSGTGGLAGSFAGADGRDLFYSPTTARMRSVGSVGTAQMLRMHLASGFPTNAESVAAATDTLALIDTEIGTSWTEWRVCDLASCDSDPNGTARWSLFERNGSRRPAGVPYLVASAADARCLVNGREPLAPSGATCAHVTSNPARYVPMGAISVGAPGSCPAGTAVGPYCRRDFIRNDMRGAAVDDRRFVVWCARETSDPLGTCRSHELVDVVYTGGGPQAHAFGGDIGAEVEEALALDPSDPAYPLFNSLGFPRNFVPPLENELIDDDDSREDSWQTYLTSATRAQQEATALLQTARQHELEQLAYDRTVEAQLDSAALAQQETVSAICGADTPEAQCDVQRIPRLRLGAAAGGVPGLEIFADPGPSEAFSFGGMPYDCTDVATAVDRVSGQERIRVLRATVQCARWQLQKSLAALQVHDVPTAVADEVLATSRSGVPGGEFTGAGGEVRQKLIALYQNFEDLRSFARSLDSSVATVVLELDTLWAKYGSTENGWFEGGFGCAFKAAITFVAALTAVVAAAAATGGTAAVAIAGAVISGAYNLDGVVDQCADANIERATIVRSATAGMLGGLEAIAGLSDRARSLLAQVASADSSFDDMARQVELAKRRREIAERLATSGVQGDPTWRALLGIEERRATESLENAQRYAFVARRAIETRLALDMASMTSPEPYVDAPSFWVNDVFDLGTAVEYADDGTGTVTAVDVRAEALSDYLHSLASFVDGYAFDRRFSEGDDVQIVNLGEIVPADAFSAGYVDPPFVSKVLFRCNGSSDLLPGGVPVNFIVVDPLDPPAPCGVFATPTGTVDLGGVAGASFAFSIPVDLDRGYFGERFSGGNFNYRTRDLSVNLVGRALFDCERAARPTECYGDGNLQYSMRHEGETVLESWDGDQRLFPFEPGVIQRARALADERWLTNPLSSTDTALITPYTRVEWWGRPLAGTYTLEIESRPEMEWRSLENVQVLIRYHYWTHQR